MINDHFLKKCIQKDAKAQRMLYDLLSSRVMGISMRYSKDRDEAKDIFQEAFIKIFKNLNKLKEVEYLERWAKKITVNTAINHFKSNKKHYESLHFEALEHSGFVLDDIVEMLSQEELVRLINKLPEGFRMVFNLYIVEGYNHKEIGEMLNISEGTSKSQLSRAKTALKKELKKLGINHYEYHGKG